MKRKNRKLALAEQPGIQASTDTTSTGGSQAFDAATNSPTRSSFTAYPTNSRNELRSYTRKEIVKLSRGLQGNLPFYGRLCGFIQNHAIGRGIMAHPATTDEAWNEINRISFDEWASAPSVYSVDGSRDFYEDQRWVAENLFIDGGYFAALVKTANGQPMIQPFDVFEIDSGYQNKADGWDDGVKCNPFGRVMQYAVRELPVTSFGVQDPTIRPVNAQDMIHVRKLHRVKSTRGLPLAFAGEATGTHLLDMVALLIGEAKLHSLLTVQVNRSARANGKGVMGAVQKADATDRDNLSGLENVIGPGQINYVGQDGEIKLLTSDRPSPDVVAFTKELKRALASSIGLPLEVVEYMADAGGAASRGVIDVAQALLDFIQETIIWRHSQRIYVWRTALAMRDGIIPKCKDPLWWRCMWQGPPKLTVDPGRTAQSDIKLVKNGMLSTQRYYSRQGLDWKEEVTSQIKFLQWAQEQCDKAGVPIERLIEPTPGAGSSSTATQEQVDPAAVQREAVKANAEMVKTELDATGVGVRAGVITPSQADEGYFRQKLGLPAASPAVSGAWSEDGGVRRPITLAVKAEPAPATSSSEDDPEE